MVCLVLGDSIAVGTQQALAEQGVVCERRARVGISSNSIEDYPVVTNANTVIISAGSNDNPRLNNVPTYERLRAKYVGKKVVWILPRNRIIARQVLQVIVKYRDAYVDGYSFEPADRLHPKYYGSVARAVRKKM